MSDKNKSLLLVSVGALGALACAAIYKQVKCYLKGNSCPYVSSSAGEYQLVYFRIRGRAEVPRLILEEAGMAYTSVGIGDDDMKVLKVSGQLAFGQVPLLKHGDFNLVQSNAIIRYLGRQFNRYGSNARQRAQIDVILDGAEDLRSKYLKLIYVDEASANSKSVYFENVAKVWLKFFEELLIKNNDGRSFFVGDKLSVADLSVYEEVDKHSRLFPDVLAGYPRLNGHKARIEAIPNIAAYLKSGRRPENVNGNGQGN